MPERRAYLAIARFLPSLGATLDADSWPVEIAAFVV
jgi:hypothetical protein